MKKILFSLFSIFILLALPLQAIEMDMSVLNDLSKDISKDLHVPTIVGKDNREEITKNASETEQATVVIEIRKSGGLFACSGVMVGSNIVLTAAHCLTDDEGNIVEGVKVYAVGVQNQKPSDKKQNLSLKMDNIASETPKETDLPNESPTQEKTEKKILKQPKWMYDKSIKKNYPFAISERLWVPDEYVASINDINDTNPENTWKHDYGLIVLNCNLGDITGQLKLKIVPNEELFKTNITVVGYNNDKLYRNLYKSPGKIGKVYEYEIYHNADTFKGNSGGPIFKDDDPQNIIALHIHGKKQKHAIAGYPNSGLRIRQEIIDAIETVAKGETLPEMKGLKDNNNSN